MKKIILKTAVDTFGPTFLILPSDHTGSLLLKRHQRYATLPPHRDIHLQTISSFCFRRFFLLQKLHNS